jgi:hypothetical protein
MSKETFKPTVRFAATRKQLKRLQPLKRALLKHRGYILGEVYLTSNDKAERIGTMRFHYIPTEAADVIQEGIKKAAIIVIKEGRE